jgi:predicted helicase
MARIKRQNSRKISVIIGNPPYNANQANENDNNKNREYPEVDARIRQTYIAESTAQKTKLYDMYARFFRWASDRLDTNGVLAFVTNRSFVESRTFDGFRKVVAQEFAELYVVDLGGDVRANPKLSGTKHNVFGIQTGVAISFLVKRKGSKGGRVFYARRPELETAEEKLAWLGSAALSGLSLEEIRPDAKQNWLNLTSNDFATLMPIASKDVKGATKPSQEKAIFKLFSLGISTNRDEWVYGDDPEALARQMRFFTTNYDAQRPTHDYDTAIKWSRNLKRRFEQGRRETFDAERVTRAAYRPFYSPHVYDSDLFIDEGGSKAAMFPLGKPNCAICFSDVASRTNYVVLAVGGIADLHFGSSIDAYQQVPLYRYDDAGNRIDNITDWSLAEFKKHYQPGRGRKPQPITKEAIFHYVYAVLHDPSYREKYAQNLKREFPRIPLHGDSESTFWQWAAWGEALMALHIGYEQAAPFALVRTDVADEKVRAAGQSPKCLLKSAKEAGRILIDSETTLAGVPPDAWAYMLGNRCAIDWVLDQYKEKNPKDPTIREKFDTYRFADHKEKVIDLLMRVTTVSVETARMVTAMTSSPR